MPTLFEKENELFFHTYKRLPLDIVRGEGVYLFDRSGKRYLDFFGGLAVNALGYGHPAVLRAIEEQSRKYIHLSNFFVQEPQVELVERLLSATGFRRAFLCNSGTEALEGAVKLVRKWGGGTGKTRIFGMSNAFHGRTFAALSLMDKAKYRDGFEQTGLRPDIVLVAKAIGGGLPLGGILGNDRVAEAFTYGVHGTTFGGNPVACAAGVAVLKEIVDGGLMKNAATIGKELHEVGRRLHQEFPLLVRETRGYGCMIGIDLKVESQPVAV